MHAYVGHVLTVFAGFFAIMNPVAGTPVFLSLTEGDSPAVRRAVARRALIIAFAIVLVFTLAGELIFSVFAVGLPAFRITGGLLVLLIGFHMLQGKTSSVQSTRKPGDDKTLAGELDKAVSPLALPLLAGPGTITTAISYSAGLGIAEHAATLAAFLLLCLITYVCYIYGERLTRYLGHDGMGVITRLMGLILAVIGTQMILDGVAAARPLANA